MNRMTSYGVAAALIAALVALAWLWWQQPEGPAQRTEPAPERSSPEAPPGGAQAPEPAIRHPVETPAAADAPLPGLDESDGVVKSALDELLGPKAVLAFLRSDGFIRRTVATIDNLGRSHAAPRLWPVDVTRGRFTVEGPRDATVIAAANERRYAPFVALVESVDTKRAATLYFRLYPLFQAAYEELGYPGKYFNDRLIQVIDLLLATPDVPAPPRVELPEIHGPVKPARPWVNYRFSDPALEGLAAGQKMLLRVGPDNARRLKAKLAGIRREVTGGTPSR